MRRLSSGFPATTTGPESPPVATPSAESSRRPPLCCSGPWHRQHRAASTGRTFFSNRSTTVGSGPAALTYGGIARITKTNPMRQDRIRRLLLISPLSPFVEQLLYHSVPGVRHPSDSSRSLWLGEPAPPVGPVDAQARGDPFAGPLQRQPRPGFAAGDDRPPPSARHRVADAGLALADGAKTGGVACFQEASRPADPLALSTIEY